MAQQNSSKRCASYEINGRYSTDVALNITQPKSFTDLKKNEEVSAFNFMSSSNNSSKIEHLSIKSVKEETCYLMKYFDCLSNRYFYQNDQSPNIKRQVIINTIESKNLLECDSNISIENDSYDNNNFDISQQNSPSSISCQTYQIGTIYQGSSNIIVPESIKHKNSFNDSSMIISFNQDFLSYRSQIMARE